MDVFKDIASCITDTSTILRRLENHQYSQLNITCHLIKLTCQTDTVTLTLAPADWEQDRLQRQRSSFSRDLQWYDMQCQHGLSRHCCQLCHWTPNQHPARHIDWNDINWTHIHKETSRVSEGNCNYSHVHLQQNLTLHGQLNKQQTETLNHHLYTTVNWYATVCELLTIP